MLTRMSESPSGDPRETAAADGPGILAGLPHTRPQRASARRAAARAATSGTATAGETTHAPTAGGETHAPARNSTRAPARKAPRTHAHEATRSDAARAPTRKASSSAPGKAPRTPARNSTRAPTRKAPPSAARKAPRATAGSRSEPAGESVPLQGYEPEEGALNRTIQPPGGAELVTSIAELAGELAKAGVNTGGRWLRDVFSRLPSG
jgi:hypothetical protein